VQWPPPSAPRRLLCSRLLSGGSSAGASVNCLVSSGIIFLFGQHSDILGTRRNPIRKMRLIASASVRISLESL